MYTDLGLMNSIYRRSWGTYSSGRGGAGGSVIFIYLLLLNPGFLSIKEREGGNYINMMMMIKNSNGPSLLFTHGRRQNWTQHFSMALFFCNTYQYRASRRVHVRDWRALGGVFVCWEAII